ncbi:uncharacterized protein LOC105218763 [Zeugodacus cucurbitae]|uniref:uncharacterized protein LOC105218763 n=1 Tax=Zeugodacus cucurbitae TaxID=28588 RepID=UPI0005968874|nr:uncharacterized protein LOC105218763 [Zeugodacus cucurbitae]XP_054082527.1 uncharacterized protein LOC105218763 [Zeugodacus cucurbitae]XP_054082528.1 uncharacterized protein LOC105218763 [Zeugodacus cucurbitae]
MSGQLSSSGTSTICLLLLLLAIVFLPQNVKAQANKVSPKLDFDEAENKNSSDVPIVPGTGQGGRVDGNQNRSGKEDGANGRDSDATTNTNSGGGGKSGPKIHGVRVTVDTGDTRKSKENTESVEITDVGKHKKRVGIHTDITFEISTDGDSDGNATSAAQDGAKEDASVPIFKGRSRPTQKSRKPYDPKNQWNPNFSSERRSYEGGSHASGPAYYHPQYYPNNVPVYVATGDGRGSSVGTVYRSRGDGWNSYVPSSSIWTTERSYSEQYRPNTVAGHRTPSWKPCYCMTSAVDNRRRRENTHVMKEVLQPTSPALKVIDAKLEKPFSSS